MRKLIAATAIGGALLSGALGMAGTANAYPGSMAVNVCELLDSSPSTYTINRYFNITYNAGLDEYAAGAQLDASVQGYCPRHLGLVNYYRALQGQPPLPGYYHSGNEGYLA